MLTERGTLKETQIASLLLTLFEQGLTGILNIKKEKIHKTLYFIKGSLIWATSNSKDDELENILKTLNLVAPKNIERVRKMAGSSEALGKSLVEKGLLTLENLIEASREQLKGILASVLKWQDGEFQFVREDPPQRLLSLGLDITAFIRDFILKGLDIEYIRQQIGSQQDEYVKNPENRKIKKYNLSETQLQLLNCFDGATSLEAVLARYPEGNRDSVLKTVYYFLMAELLLDEKLEFLDSPLFREEKKAAGLQLESTAHEPAAAVDEGIPGKEEDEYEFGREIEVEKPATVEPEYRLEGNEEMPGPEAGEPVERGEVYEPGKEIEAGAAAAIEKDLDIEYQQNEEVPLTRAEPGEEIAAFGNEIETGRAGEIDGVPGMTPGSAQNTAVGSGPGEPYMVEGNEVKAEQQAGEDFTLPAEPQGAGPAHQADKPFANEKELEKEIIAEKAAEGFTMSTDNEMLARKKPLAPIPDKELAGDLETIKVDEDFIRDREPVTFKRVVVEEKKKSRLVYMVLLSIAVILITGGAIFLYLNSSKSSVSDDIITPPVNVDEKQPKVRKEDNRTKIPMKKENKTGQPTPKPAGKKPQKTPGQTVQKPGEKLHERFDIKSDELKKKLAEQSTANLFLVKLGDPQALKYFKEGNFIEAGKTWKKDLMKAGIKFTVLLEMDCMKESVINAFLKVDVKENFYILNRNLGSRNCFLVLWGQFYVKQEAAEAIKTIPQYFWQQQHPPEVISLSRYLSN